MQESSWHPNSLVIFERSSYNHASKAEIDSLRGLLPRKEPPEASRVKLYVSRAGSGRQLQNQEAYEEFLQTLGFQILRSNELSNIPGNARLFNQAELVIGPHDAGLANLAFCRPGTVVLEIATKNFWLLLFSALAKSAMLTHYLLFLNIQNVEDSGNADETIAQVRHFLKLQYETEF
jgi:capsular polysaccharide biosynthesis protein